MNRVLSFIKNNRDILLIIGLILFIFLYAKSCVKTKEDRKRIENLINYEHIAKTYKTKNGKLVNYNKNLEVTIDDLKFVGDTLVDYIKDLEVKNPKVITIIDEIIKLDTLRIPIYLTKCEFDTTLTIDSTYYNIDMTLKNTGVTFNTISFPNRVGVTVGDKKEKWWKRKETIVTITNSNPLVTVEGISSYTFKQKPKWYERGWIKITAGAIFGGVITYSIVK